LTTQYRNFMYIGGAASSFSNLMALTTLLYCRYTYSLKLPVGSGLLTQENIRAAEVERFPMTDANCTFVHSHLASHLLLFFPPPPSPGQPKTSPAPGGQLPRGSPPLRTCTPHQGSRGAAASRAGAAGGSVLIARAFRTIPGSFRTPWALGLYGRPGRGAPQRKSGV